MKSKINDFETDLRESELPEQYIEYMQIITAWWPNSIGWDRVTDLKEQRKGKDIVVHLSKDKSITLQFKKRRKHYDDVCIEYAHNYGEGKLKPGWIEKPSEADFLIYSTPKIVYRFRYQKLHEVWQKNKEDWINKYSLPEAMNSWYGTRNVGVPIEILKESGLKVGILEWIEE